jgi:molybdopterin molybdotransferase
MISPGTAQRLIAKHAKRLGPVSVDIEEALGHVLAEAVRSTMPLPRFDNSAMDGFAVRHGDTAGATPRRPVTLKLADTVFAGDSIARRLPRRHACGIMTGAPLPAGTDAIIPVEEAVVRGAELVVEGPVERHRHVRRRGEEVRKGAVVLKPGDVVHAGTIACLAMFGRTHVRVVRRPTVSVITTGDEAIAPGKRLERGQIYDSNSCMLRAMLRQMGIEVNRSRHVRDHVTALSNAIRAGLEASDVLIVTGGVSVGKRDHLRAVLDRLGVEEVFWRVAQKPGKPLYFGVTGTSSRRRLVFGLPGNPASAFTCFYVYVYGALRRQAGFGSAAPRRDSLRVAGEVKPLAKKWRFLKAQRQPAGRVRELPHQGSHMITTLTRTNSLMVIPPSRRPLADGAEVDTYRLPYAEDDT